MLSAGYATDDPPRSPPSMPSISSIGAAASWRAPSRLTASRCRIHAGPCSIGHWSPRRTRPSMDPSEFVDEHGRPKESPQRIPVPAILTWLGVGSAIEVLIWGVMTGVWSAALSLAGLVLGAAGALTRGRALVLPGAVAV